jgi:DNA repair photolyase
MTRMFKSITDVCNIQTGCEFFCTYCWARELAEGRLKNKPRYKDGFVPRFNPEEMRKRFKPGDFVFVCSMGDISFASPENMAAILKHIAKFPETKFLIQTKNPGAFYWWPFTPNVHFGTTIESNRDHGVSKAPHPEVRFKDFRIHRHKPKFLSIEPILDFDLDVMVRWVTDIQPAIIEIGADNHGHHLAEPPWEKVEELLKALRKICPDVKEKDGLERLKGAV